MIGDKIRGVVWYVQACIGHSERGSLVVSALAFSARGYGFDPHGRLGKILVSEHAFLSVICRDDTK